MIVLGELCIIVCLVVLFNRIVTTLLFIFSFTQLLFGKEIKHIKEGITI